MTQATPDHERAIVRETTSQRSVSIEIEASSMEACEAEREQYFDRWHPLGYGTSISPPQMSAKGIWRATGWRQTSCD
ncbi:MAG: hypothetical protein LCH61_11725 [Proteobacteria bacterium]|nr:hypothetical protein [Pseudomonadota bacterium]